MGKSLLDEWNGNRAGGQGTGGGVAVGEVRAAAAGVAAASHETSDARRRS